MARTREQQKAMFAKWGFDLTDFKKNGFQKTITELEISDKPKDFNITVEEKPTRAGFEWNGDGIKIVTGNNPITGEYGAELFKREPEKDYASYIGIEGDRAKVLKAVKLIKLNTDFRKGESKNDRDFI